MASSIVSGSLKTQVTSQAASESTAQNRPELTTFSNSTGAVAKYYFSNNPWKLSMNNTSQKVYRFCVICGNERFSSEKWSKPFWLFGSTVSCSKPSCLSSQESLFTFVPDKHFRIRKELSECEIRKARADESFEEIGSLTSFVRHDKVYSSEKDMPTAYLETFKKLESLPVELRLEEIDLIFLNHRLAHNVTVGQFMPDTSDPLLSALATYRQQCMKIFDTLTAGSHK